MNVLRDFGYTISILLTLYALFRACSYYINFLRLFFPIPCPYMVLNVMYKRISDEYRKLYVWYIAVMVCRRFIWINESWSFPDNIPKDIPKAVKMTAKKKDSFSWLAEWNGNISLIYTGFNQTYLHSFYNLDICAHLVG